MAKKCPLGDDCDLTVAWMAGAENVRQTYKARLEEAKAREGLARLEADELRKGRDHAENRCHELAMALNEVRALISGANRAEERYPLAVAFLKGDQ